MIQNDVLDSAKLEGRMEGHMEGHMEGLAEGKAEANLENAKKMKAMGIDLEMIRQITGNYPINNFGDINSESAQTPHRKMRICADLFLVVRMFVSLIRRSNLLRYPGWKT